MELTFTIVVGANAAALEGTVVGANKGNGISPFLTVGDFERAGSMMPISVVGSSFCKEEPNGLETTLGIVLGYIVSGSETGMVFGDRVGESVCFNGIGANVSLAKVGNTKSGSTNSFGTSLISFIVGDLDDCGISSKDGTR